MSHKWGFVVVYFSAVCGIEAYLPHRYHFVNKEKTWREAQTYCRQKYTDLASINNMDEMKKLNHILKKESVKKAWIGLQKERPGKWLWSLADQKFYRDGDTYRNWFIGTPNNLKKNEYCVEMYYKTGLWNDNDCEKSKKFVCYEEKDTNANRYILIKQQMKWRQAQSYCRKNHADLVSVRNKTENEEIWRLINSSVPNENVWIGLYNESWKWSDQSNSSFRYWSAEKPSEDLNCAVVSESEEHYWSDVTCTEKLPFICHEIYSDKLILVKDNLTWKEALNYCRNRHYDLVSVGTEEIQLWVDEVVQGASTEHVWLSLCHDCPLGLWYWVNGEMICYQNWALGNGTGCEDCRHEERNGAVQSGGEKKWISRPQSDKLNFICSTYED